MPVIKIETNINADRDIVFDLSRSIDLHKISTNQTKEEAIGGVTSGLIENGQYVTWRARHFGVYQKLTSKITEFKKPDYFIDEMLKGAFKSFKHEHHFIDKEGQTLMIDVFEYKSPFGLAGIIADKLFLINYMRKLLKTRNQTIKDFAESDKWKEVLKKNNEG